MGEAKKADKELDLFGTQISYPFEEKVFSSLSGKPVFIGDIEGDSIRRRKKEQILVAEEEEGMVVDDEGKTYDAPGNEISPGDKDGVDSLTSVKN